MRVLQRLRRSNIDKSDSKCIDKDLKEDLYYELSRSPFSIITDETSQLYGDNYLGLHVKYIDKEKNTISTKLLSIIELDSDLTGEAFCNKIRNELFNNNLTLDKNLVALCTDNESKMVETGKLNLFSRLKTQIPQLIHIRDLCHSYNLVCQDALETFPSYIIQFVRKVSAYFSSAQRRAKLVEIQKAQGILKPLGILKFNEIRWFNLNDVSKRIIELWKPLEQFFKERKECPLKDNFDYEHYLLLKLLICLLGRLNHYIQHFQRENLFFDRVFNKIKEGYSLFGHMILKQEYSHYDFDQLYSIPFADNNKIKNYLASDADFKDRFLESYKNFDSLLDKTKEKKPGIDKIFFNIAKNFILISIKSMKKRLPFDNDYIKQSQVVYFNNLKDKLAWKNLAKHFNNIITSENNDEFEEQLERLLFQWSNIKGGIDGFQKNYVAAWDYLSQEYPNVSQLAQAVLVFPYSSASVESSFSKLKVYRTAYRNRLGPENLEASMLIELRDSKDQPLVITSHMKEKYKNLWKI